VKILTVTKGNRAFNFLDLTVVIAMSAFALYMFVLLVPRLNNPHRGGTRIQCVNNLKQVGLSYRVWEGDNNDKYPMAVAETNGGTMDFITGPSAFRHFLVMSNELSTPKILICPAESDQTRTPANAFAEAQTLFDQRTGMPIVGPVSFLNNSNISYFVGVDAAETNAQMILSGDHNITNGTPVKNGMLYLTTNQESGWTAEMHNKVGNLLLADGSVQQLSISGLQTTVANTGVATNRMQMPILGP
jgi:hypothetical protein